jgi:hypothetical protein
VGETEDRGQRTDTETEDRDRDRRPRTETEVAWQTLMGGVMRSIPTTFTMLLSAPKMEPSTSGYYGG